MINRFTGEAPSCGYPAWSDMFGNSRRYPAMIGDTRQGRRYPAGSDMFGNSRRSSARSKKFGKVEDIRQWSEKFGKVEYRR